MAPGLKYRHLQAVPARRGACRDRNMSPHPFPAHPDPNPLPSVPLPCPHLLVQVVSHGKDAEFVECMDCREVFDPAEFKAMAIEKRLEEDFEI